MPHPGPVTRRTRPQRHRDPTGKPPTETAWPRSEGTSNKRAGTGSVGSAATTSVHAAPGRGPDGVNPQAVRSAVGRLRRKLGDDTGRLKYILAERVWTSRDPPDRRRPREPKATATLLVMHATDPCRGPSSLRADIRLGTRYHADSLGQEANDSVTSLAQPHRSAGNRSVNPVWTWERANRTLALSTASTGRMSLRRESPGPDRLAVRRCLPDCRNAGYRLDRTVTCGRKRSVLPVFWAVDAEPAERRRAQAS